jgi:hypothetical protein
LRASRRVGLAKKDDAEKRFQGFAKNRDGKMTHEEFVRPPQ